MKLVEIKNSLAKLYYEPANFPLVISDFLTIDDGNKKILSQIVSIESTNKSDTNCAILKFSLDIDENNSHSSYSGYTPPLDAKIEKTNAKVLNSIFSGAPKTVNMGRLTNSSKMPLNIDADLLNKFLYVQSDIFEETTSLFEKIANFNFENNKKTLIFDYDNLAQYNNANNVELGKDFKLPINNETLNYIYENDLTGLSVEQKTIVQDIILEIQEYINTLEQGYIPFNTLLDVVNSIYETDKSIGVILLRNKLLKYKQYDIFATTQQEIDSLRISVQNNIITALNVSKVTANWQKEAMDFVLNNIEDNFCLITVLNDENTNKEILNKLYKNANIVPVISTSYECLFSQQLKSFAKNLILFKPQEQQRAFATYNSFLMKLAQKEFIISGETTYYTPLILENNLEKFVLNKQDDSGTDKVDENIIEKVEAYTLDEIPQQEEVELLDDTTTQIDAIEEAEELPILEEDQSELKNIFEESLENEIAKDVDQMFYADTNDIQEQVHNTEEKADDEALIDYNELITDDDLDLLDNIQNIEETDNQIDVSQDSMLISDEQDLTVEKQEETLSDELLDLNEEQEILENITENNSLPGVPIYTTDSEDAAKSDESVKIAEGNIVYHEKYGRGVVEELFNYGKRTLCSIQFDNVGRRLLDPNLADLKQM